VTALLPTPSSATILPPLQSRTSSIASAASTTARSTFSLPSDISTTESPTSSQFAGAASGFRADDSSYNSLVAWLVVLVVGTFGFCVNLVL
jgi:hypothetical protein